MKIKYLTIIRFTNVSLSLQNSSHTNYSRQRSISIKPRFNSSVKFKKIDCRFSDKKHPVDFAVVKELDEETNLCYYGARYLDPRTSRWIAGDPAIWQGDYIPVAPTNDEARKHNQNLPGMGGIFNIVNMHAYHYAGNNPVKYVDPDGRDIILLVDPDGAPLSSVGERIPFGDRITFGHSAALVGNDDDGWLYYSSNGPNNISIGIYSSLEEFREQYPEREPHFNFSHEQRLFTTPEQDQRMKAKALELANVTMDQIREGENYLVVPHPLGNPYRIASNNCAHHVAQIARAGGQHSIYTNIPRLQILASPEAYRQYQRLQFIQSLRIY